MVDRRDEQVLRETEDQLFALMKSMVLEPPGDDPKTEADAHMNRMREQVTASLKLLARNGRVDLVAEVIRISERVGQQAQARER